MTLEEVMELINRAVDWKGIAVAWDALQAYQLAHPGETQNIENLYNAHARQDAVVKSRESAGADGAGYVPPEGVPSMWESPAALERREQNFLEQEAQPSDVFRQYLQQLPLYGQTSAMGRTVLERQGNQALQSFLMQRGSTEDLFRDYLSSGGKVLNPQEMKERLGEIGGYFDIPAEQRTEAQAFQTGPEQFGSNPNAFQAYQQALLAKTNPLFRAAARDVSQGIYDRFQGTTPDMPFIQYMRGRGGFAGGR